MGTIVKEYGPIYGEVVNGTVQGRPNGSVYVPISNTISLSLGDNYIKKVDSFIDLCTSEGGLAKWIAVAQAQDLASYLQTQVSASADFSDYVKRSGSAGIFNTDSRRLASSASDFAIVDGTTYYVRAQLIASTNVPVATSNVYEVVGVEEE